jgi:hypothetical protein
VIAIGQPPTNDNKWLTEEVMQMFTFHGMPNITSEEAIKLVQSKVNQRRIIVENTSKWLNTVTKLLRFSDLLQRQKEERGDIHLELSTRQILRIALRTTKYPDDLYNAIHQTFLSRLLPSATRAMLNKLCDQSGISPTESTMLY